MQEEGAAAAWEESEVAQPEIVVKIHRTPGLQDGVVGLSEEAMQWMQPIIGGRCECRAAQSSRIFRHHRRLTVLDYGPPAPRQLLAERCPDPNPNPNWELPEKP